MFDYYLRMAPFLGARSAALFPSSNGTTAGFWQVETATVFGAYAQVEIERYSRSHFCGDVVRALSASIARSTTGHAAHFLRGRPHFPHGLDLILMFNLTTMEVGFLVPQISRPPVAPNALCE